MKRYSNNYDTVAAYVNQRSEDGQNGNHSIFFRDNVLYSYGTHFPLAIRLNDGTGYICNGDRYSVTTLAHQGLVFDFIPDRQRCEIPFSALVNIIHTWDQVGEIKSMSLLDMQGDNWIDTGRVSEKTGNTIYNHVLGGALIQYNSKKYLSGVDETGKGNGQYFLTELTEFDGIETVVDAYANLKPFEVETAEREGRAVYRQGEWFFIEQKDVSLAVKKEAVKDYKLIGLDGDTGHHIASKGYFLMQSQQYVQGIIKHERGEHYQLKLYETGTKPKYRQWFKAVHNNQIQSWSSNGDFD